MAAQVVFRKAREFREDGRARGLHGRELHDYVNDQLARQAAANSVGPKPSSGVAFHPNVASGGRARGGDHSAWRKPKDLRSDGRALGLHGRALQDYVNDQLARREGRQPSGPDLTRIKALRKEGMSRGYTGESLERFVELSCRRYLLVKLNQPQPRPPKPKKRAKTRKRTGYSPGTSRSVYPIYTAFETNRSKH